MPAAAVIPAPIAYIKVVAVKTLVVETLLVRMGRLVEYALILAGIYLIYPTSKIVGYSETLL